MHRSSSGSKAASSPTFSDVPRGSGVQKNRPRGVEGTRTRLGRLRQPAPARPGPMGRARPAPLWLFELARSASTMLRTKQRSHRIVKVQGDCVRLLPADDLAEDEPLA
jgi:hypothetical protein